MLVKCIREWAEVVAQLAEQVASYTRDMRFESRHWHILFTTITKLKDREWPNFFKKKPKRSYNDLGHLGS